MSKNKNKNNQSTPSVSGDTSFDEIDAADLMDFDSVDEVSQEQSSITEPPLLPEEQTNNIVQEESSMPATEVKHQEVLPAAQSESTATVTVKKTTADRFNLVARKYINIAKNGVSTEEQRREALLLLADMMQIVTTSHDRAVFDACFSFFLTNRGVMLSQQTVVGGVTKYVPESKVTKVIQFYVIFSSLVESKLLHKRYTINTNHVRDIFNNRQLGEWLSDKR